MYPGHDLDLSMSPDVIVHVTIRLALCGFQYLEFTFFLSGSVTEIFW